MGTKIYRTEADFGARLQQIEREDEKDDKRRGKRQVVTIDKETGEHLDGVAVMVKRKVPHEYKDWVAMSQQAICDLVTDKTLRPESLKVFLFLVGVMRFENWLPLCQTDVAEAMSIAKPHINRAFGDLIERGLIEKGARIGRTFEYRLTPEVAWKGRSANLVKARRQQVKDRKLALKVIEGGKAGVIDDVARKTAG